MIGILVMMNNYFHDVASAMLIIAVLFMVFMTKDIENASRDVKIYFSDVYKKMSHVIGGTVIFIFMAGIVRTFTYKDFEWANAVGAEQVPAIIVKHLIILFFVVYGIIGWLKLHKKIKKIREEIKLVPHGEGSLK